MTVWCRYKLLRVLPGGAAVLATAVAIAACGSSSSGSGGASAVSGASPSATKSPITVGAVAAANTAQVNFGGIFAALQQGAKVVNAKGGVNGHPIKVWTCNTQYQAAQELACVRHAVAAGIDVMVGDNNDFIGPPYMAILRNAGIPDVENSGPLPFAFQGPLTYQLTFPQSEFASCTAPALTKVAGGNKIAVVTNVPGPALAATTPLWEAAAKAQGDTWLPVIAAPMNTADWSPYVASAEKSGANIVIIAMLGGAPQAFVRASSQAGAKYTICTAIGLSGSGGWYNLGSAASHLYVGSDTASLTSSGPLVKEFVSEINAAQKAGVANATVSPHGYFDQTAEAWLGLQAVIQAASTIKGDITKQSLAQALQTTKFNFGGMIPQFSFADKPESGASSPSKLLQTFQHVWNSTGYLWKWNPSTGQYTQFATLPDTFGLALKGAGS